MLRKRVVILAAVLATAQANAFAERASDFRCVKAPPLHACKISAKVDLGLWDDAFALDDADLMILRKGDDLFSLSLTGAPHPRKLATARGITGSRIVCGARCGKRVWLFCHASGSKMASPFAVDAITGKKTDFEVSGASFPPTRGAQIGSWVMVSKTNAAVFHISGGDAETWPRDGNRPIYFWFDLRSGRVRQLPIGWDLEFFSADQSTAVFQKSPARLNYDQRPPPPPPTPPPGSQPKPDSNRYGAISTRTGQDTLDILDRRKDYWIPFVSSNTETVKLIRMPQKPETGHSYDFAGLSVNGFQYHFSLPVNGEFTCCNSAAVSDGWTAFRTFIEGRNGPSYNSVCYVGPLKNDGDFLLIGDRVRDCALMGAGTGVFAQSGYGSKRDSTEAFFFDAKTKCAWNVLDDIERLSELSSEDARKKYIEDKMGVQIVRGNSERGRKGLVLCAFRHFRGDVRTCGPELASTGGRVVEMQNWYHSVVVAADGSRYDAGALNVDSITQRTWLHNSGKLIIGDLETRKDASDSAQEIHLRMMDIGIDR